MKTLYNKLHIFGQTMLLVFFTLSVLSLGSCSKETLDYNHPDVDLFVKQLKAGKYSTQSPDGLSNMPKFTSEDIEELLKYAEDLTVIPSFPLAPVSYSAGGKLVFGYWHSSTSCVLFFSNFFLRSDPNVDIVTSFSANHIIILLLSFIITSLHTFLNPYFPRKSPLLSDLRLYCFFQGQAPMFLNP